MAKEPGKKQPRKPVQRRTITKTKVAAVKKRVYKPTGKPVGRPKLDPENAVPVEGVRKSRQPVNRQGEKVRSTIAAVGLDPKSIVARPGVVGNPSKLSEVDTSKLKPIDIAEVHDHPWTTLQSMKSADPRVPRAIARKLNREHMDATAGARQFNFRAGRLGTTKWEIQRQDAFCKDCDPSNPKATEIPPAVNLI